MLRSPRIPLLTAVVAFAALGLVWVLAYHVGPAQRLDRAVFQAVSGDQNHARETIPLLFAVWMVPPVYALLAAVVLVFAWTRRGAATAVAAGLLILGANVVGQVLKSVTATERPWAVTQWGHTVDAVSWPSGHATAATALVLAAVLAAAPANRRRTAVLGGLFAAGMGVAVVRMAWHMPSDALGGWYLSVGFGGLVLAGLRVWEARTARVARRRAAVPSAQSA